MPRHGRRAAAPAIQHEIMPFGLDQHGMVERRIQRRGSTLAQGVAQIDLIVLP